MSLSFFFLFFFFHFFISSSFSMRIICNTIDVYSVLDVVSLLFIPPLPTFFNSINVTNVIKIFATKHNHCVCIISARMFYDQYGLFQLASSLVSSSPCSAKESRNRHFTNNHSHNRRPYCRFRREKFSPVVLQILKWFFFKLVYPTRDKWSKSWVEQPSRSVILSPAHGYVFSFVRRYYFK